MSILTTVFTGAKSLLSSWKLYIYAIIAGAAVAFWLSDRYAQYEQGYNAAVHSQDAAIAAYQGIVVEKERKYAEELSQLSAEHAADLEKAKAAIPAIQEKIRVVTKTIQRPAVCNLADSELRLINEAVHSANGASKASH